MGVCCSTTAKPANTSSSRHYVSAISSPNLFPTERENKKDSAVASHVEEKFSRFENAVERANVEGFKEERSTSGSVETGVHPICANLCEETAVHPHQREKESLEDVFQQRTDWPESVGKRSEESSTENEAVDNKAVASKPRCTGAKTRLKKKDSTRQRKYKDEIMLSDSIDSIVEKEIPEITDEGRELTKDIEYILNDDIPAVESNGTKSLIPSITPRPSMRRKKSKEDTKLARDIEYILSDDTKSNEESASSPDATSPPKTSNAIGRNKNQLKKEAVEGHLASSPPAISSVSKDDPFKVDSRVPTPPSAGAAPNTGKKDTALKLKQVVEGFDLNASTVSSQSRMQNDSLASLGTKKHPKKKQTTENDTTEDEKLAQDIDYILNDDVARPELNGKNSFGKGSPKKKLPRNKKYSTKQQKNMDEKELEKDIDYILNDNVGTAEYNEVISDVTVSPTKKTQRPKTFATKEDKNMDDRELAEDIDYILSDDIGRAESKYKGNEESAKGIGYIVNDDTSAKSNGKIASGTDSPTTPTKKARNTKKDFRKKEQKGMDDSRLEENNDCTLKENVLSTDSNQQSSSATVSSSTKPQRLKKYPTSKKDVMDDQKLAEDIDYILNDDVDINEPNGQISFAPVPPKKKGKRAKKLSTKEQKNMDDKELEKDVNFILNDDITTAESDRQISSGTVSPTNNVQRPKRSSKRGNMLVDDKKLTNDVDLVLKDDIPAAESNSQISSAKVSSKKKVSFQETNKTDEKLEKDIQCILKDDTVEDVSNGKISSGLSALPPPEKEGFARKHCKWADDQLAKDIQYILNDDVFTADSNDEAYSSGPDEVPRPKTSNPKLSLAMDLDRIFDPASVASSNQADDKLVQDIEYILNDNLVDVSSNGPALLRSGAARRLKKQSLPTPKQEDGELLTTNEKTLNDENVQGTSNEPLSSSLGAALHLRKITPVQKSKYIAMAGKVAEETDSKSTKTSTSQDLRLQRDFASKSGTAKYTRTHSKRTKENTEEKALSKDIDDILKVDLHPAESVRPIGSSLPRRKTRNPKLTLAKNMSKTEGSLSAASSSLAVRHSKQDFSPKPTHATEDGSIQCASNGQILSSVCAAPRTNKDFSKKSKDMLTLEDVDSSMQIDSSSWAVPRSPKDSSRKQRPAKNVVIGKKSDDNLQDNKDVTSIRSIASSSSDDTPLRMKRPTRLPNEILNIPTTVSSTSVENLSDVGTSLRKSNFTRQPKQSKHTEEVNLEEAINYILEIPALDGDSKEAVKLSTMGKERKTKSRKKVDTCESRGIDTQQPTAQTLVDTGVVNVEFPDAKASSSSIETKNYDSGDTMRPMAAGSSRIASKGCSASPDTVKPPPSDKTRQQLSKRKRTLPAILKDESTVRKPRMTASRETTVPSLGRLESMTRQSKPVVHLTGLNSHRTTSGIFYESDEVELMKEIERESRRH